MFETHPRLIAITFFLALAFLVSVPFWLEKAGPAPVDPENLVIDTDSTGTRKLILHVETASAFQEEQYQIRIEYYRNAGDALPEKGQQLSLKNNSHYWTHDEMMRMRFGSEPDELILPGASRWESAKPVPYVAGQKVTMHKTFWSRAARMVGLAHTPTVRN